MYTRNIMYVYIYVCVCFILHITKFCKETKRDLKWNALAFVQVENNIHFVFACVKV